MTKLRSLFVWVIEMLCEAIGTTLWMAVLAVIQYGRDSGHYPYGYAGILFGISAMVLIEFALTGYLLTSLLAAYLVPRQRWFSTRLRLRACTSFIQAFSSSPLEIGFLINRTSQFR